MVIGRFWFTLWLGHSKDHHKNGRNCLLVIAWHVDIRVVYIVWQCSLTELALAVYGTVYRHIHYKDLLGSIVRVGYCILVLDFYLSDGRNS